jgi:hypothetical protein
MPKTSYGFCIALALLASLPAAWAAATAEKSKASVLALDVTVDGAARPDVGRAMADAFSAAMLKRGNYRLFANETAPKPQKPKGKKGEIMLGAGPAPAAPKPAVVPQLDYLFTFNLIGQDSRYALTVKKIDAKTQEVLDAQEFATQGPLDKVFTLVPQALDKLDAKKRVHPFPVSQAPSEIRAAQPVVRQLVNSAPTRSPGTYTGVPPEYADKDLSRVPKAYVYRRVGSITETNGPWKFAVVQPADGKTLGISDTVQVLWDDNGKTYSELKVSNTDSGKVITDLGHNASHHPLFRGDAVYGWAQPLW